MALSVSCFSKAAVQKERQYQEGKCSGGPEPWTEILPLWRTQPRPGRSWDAFLSCWGWSLEPQVTEKEEASASRLGTSDSGVGQKTLCLPVSPG